MVVVAMSIIIQGVNEFLIAPKDPSSPCKKKKVSGTAMHVS